MDRPRLTFAVGCLLMLLAWTPAWSASTWLAPGSVASTPNPFPATPDAVAAGQTIFAQRCAICHGTQGLGDGPGGIYLVPRPASLADPSMWNQTDGTMFWKISTGRNAMPAWSINLSVEDRWKVLDFIRTLAPRPKAAAAAPGPKG